MSNPLILAGGIVLATGYLPPAAIGAPSFAGSLYQVSADLLTLGVTEGNCQDARDIGTPDRSYLCSGKANAGVLVVPFVGPFIYASHHDDDTFLNPTGKAPTRLEAGLLYTSGALQFVGAALILVGFALEGSGPRPGVKPADAPTPRRASLSVLPMLSPSSIGLGFSLTP